MKIPFRKRPHTPTSKRTPAAPALDPVLAAEQRRRVIEYGRTEADEHPPEAGPDGLRPHDAADAP
jgi:hypothetical protein